MASETSRRVFLRTTGAAVLGIGAGLPLVRALASEIEGPDDEAAKGPRWAMVVDTRKCAAQGDCTACTKACHEIHNVPDVVDPVAGEADSEEAVKWIWKESYVHAVPGQEHAYLPSGLRERPVPVFCNHCQNPPCVRVCPTQATWQREDGVVMMDMHRCIGCRYCIVGCPYGSRSFNWRDPRPHLDKINPDFPTRSKGVVEKCNFCAEKGRLSDDGTWTPACVAACPARALSWGDIRDAQSEIRKILAGPDVYTVLRKPELGTRPHVFYIV